MAVSVTKGFDAEYLKKEIARQEAARQREAGREARGEAAAREVGQPGAAARYYTAAAGQWEPSGWWIGKDAPRLGLTGDVKADVLDRVFVGQRAPGAPSWAGPGRTSRTPGKALERAEQRIAAARRSARSKRTRSGTRSCRRSGMRSPTTTTPSRCRSVSVQWMAALSDAGRA